MAETTRKTKNMALMGIIKTTSVLLFPLDIFTSLDSGRMPTIISEIVSGVSRDI